MSEVLEQNKEALAELCRRFRVERLEIFGSAAGGKFKSDSSDLDFIVLFADAASPGYADRYLDLAEGLERCFGRSVDLLTEGMIRNPYFRKAVNQSRRLIYDRRSEEAAA